MPSCREQTPPESIPGEYRHEEQQERKRDLTVGCSGEERLMMMSATLEGSTSARGEVDGASSTVCMAGR